MSQIQVKFHNYCFVKLITEPSIENEISNYFKFQIPDFHLKKRFNKSWHYNFDGYIRLYNKKTKQLPYGLLKNLYLFSEEHNYNLLLDDLILNDKNNITQPEFIKYIETLNLNVKLRNYQENALFYILNKKKATIVSPTSSGKCVYDLELEIEMSDSDYEKYFKNDYEQI